MSQSRVIASLQQGIRKHQSGDLQSAAQIYTRVLRKDPAHPDALHLSGLVAHAQGDHKTAERLLRRAIQTKPREPEFQCNLAAVLLSQSRSAEAEQLCRQVLKARPSHAAALSHLGTSLRQQHRLSESLVAFQQAAATVASPSSLCNLGSVLTDLGRFEEACEVLLRARQLGPDRPQIHINLAVVEWKLGWLDQALQSLAAAEQLNPDLFEIYLNRGNLFLGKGQVLDAIEQFQRAIAIDSSRPSAVLGLGRALERAGCWEETLEAYRLAAELDPQDQRYQSSYLYSACLSPLLSEEDVGRLHAAWGLAQETTVSPVTNHGNSLLVDRRLRIGYVSPDFRSHATMRFLFPFFAAHDRQKFELFCYSETIEEDGTTAKVRSLSDGWCSTRELSDEQLSSRIQQDKIDILVDLAGHTAGNRLPVFARKPAPVQVSFLGYPCTSGLSRIDYFLTDAIRQPEASRGWFVEQPVRLPHGSCCYEAAEAAELTPPPCLQNGYPTLGSTHRLEKLSPQTLRLWATVMAALPESRLLIFRDVLSSTDVREQCRAILQDAGINTGRVSFGWDLPKSHLEIYSQIDVLLEVFPWGSGTVAYDTMWMGVPIPTLLTDRSSCRSTASMMHFAGFPELIAATEDDYVRLVTELAVDTPRLSDLRQSIRPQMQKTVCDGSRFARDIESAYRTMWQQYVADRRQQEGLSDE